MKYILTMLFVLAISAGMLFAQNAIWWIEDFEDFAGFTDPEDPQPDEWKDLSYYGAEVLDNVGVNDSHALKFRPFYDNDTLNYDNMFVYSPRIDALPANSILKFEYRVLEHGSTTVAGDLNGEWIECYVWDENMINYEGIGYIDETTHIPSTSYATASFSLADYEGMAGHIQFYIWIEYVSDFDIYIDNVRIEYPAPLQHDLRAMSITGFNNPMMNVEYDYIVTVKNIGSETISAGDYTVTLYRVDAQGSNVVATLDGTSLAFNQSDTFVFHFIPTSNASADIYGLVEMDGEDDDTNNQTENLTLYVQPYGQPYFGDTTSTETTTYAPFRLNYYQSLVQTIYYEDEIGITGNISAVSYTYSRANSPDTFPSAPIAVKMWMATTTQDVFEEVGYGEPHPDAIPYADFTLVYDDTIPVNVAGTNDITITLSTHFPYNGDNLVIMTQRMNDGEWYHANNKWLATLRLPQMRTLVFYEDGEQIPDLSEGYPNFDLVAGLIPNTRLFFETETSIGNQELTPLSTPNLRGNYPNPFNPSTTITFDMVRESPVSIDVYNIKGQKVKTIADEMYGIGTHKVVWNGEDFSGKPVASGVYFYRMTTSEYSQTRKMVLMK